MGEQVDHARAHDLFRRILTGRPPPHPELRRAVDHIATCPSCARIFEVGPTAACQESEEDLPVAAWLVGQGEEIATRLPAVARHLEGCERCRMILAQLVADPEKLSDMDEPPVDPTGLFARALAAGLSPDRDRIARRRAAEESGTFQPAGPALLARLAEAAGQDRDQQVREAALAALDELDTQVSIPQRVIEAWSATPSEAAPFIAEVLERLAGQGRPTVAELTGSPVRGRHRVEVAGAEGIHGTILEEHKDLWLSLEGLPPRFERITPVVAIPGALRKRRQPIKWSGGRPGLVPADRPVVEGSMAVLLGTESAPVRLGELFSRIYLLKADLPLRRSWA